MKKIVAFINNLGYSNTVLVVTLTITSIILLLITFTDTLQIIDKNNIINIALVTIMTSITVLLVISIQQKNESMSGVGLKGSGILSVVTEVTRTEFEEIFRSDKKVIILNTWIYNISEITPSLKKYLGSKDAQIEFYILSSDSEFVKFRGKELGRDAGQAIMNCKLELSYLLKSLTVGEASRIKVFSYDSMPKITLFGSKQHALVGFFWPKLNAVHGPHFLINNTNGSFSKMAWNYFETLETKDITNELEK